MLRTPLHLRGGRLLSGEISVQYSKNAALPILVASLMSPEPVLLHGIPRLSDVSIILEIMTAVGTQYEWVGSHSLRLHTPTITSYAPPHELVAKMRASFILMGAILARVGKAEVSTPGGCAWGPRPVDQHLKALRAIGAQIHEEDGTYFASTENGPRGRYHFDLLTVGGTHNALLASVVGHSEVVLENASIDTDVVDLAHFLNTLGADISGIGTHTLTIRGVESLHGSEYTVIPDRIEAGTWMMLAAATRSCLTLVNVIPEHLSAVTAKLREMGIEITESERSILVDATKQPLKPVNITAQSYPGFPTDLLPQMSALLCTVEGISVIQDPVYPDRLTHVAPLCKMGAQINVRGFTQVIQGAPLHGAEVAAEDLRAGAALFIAGLSAQGETMIEGVQYLNRGYEDLLSRLKGIGADAFEQSVPKI